MPITKSWTPKDTDKLREMVLKGQSVFRASAALGRPVLALRKKARDMGLRFPGTREVRQQMKDAGALD